MCEEKKWKFPNFFFINSNLDMLQNIDAGLSGREKWFLKMYKMEFWTCPLNESKGKLPKCFKNPISIWICK